RERRVIEFLRLFRRAGQYHAAATHFRDCGQQVNSACQIIVKSRQDRCQLTSTGNMACQMKHDLRLHTLAGTTHCGDVLNIALQPLKLFAVRMSYFSRNGINSGTTVDQSTAEMCSDEATRTGH